MSAQTYVSPELHHFVGRSHLNDPEGAYTVLKAVLKEQHIRMPSAVQPRAMSFNTDLTGSLLDGKLVQPNLVCFCDIPKSQLQIHVRKYGPFGLSFPKLFMVSRRARPVT